MKILWQDVVVVLGFLLYFASGFATNYIISSLSGLGEAALNAEMNPIVRSALNIAYGIVMVQFIGVAFLGGFYYLLRRKVVKNPTESNIQLLSFYTISMTLIFAQLFMNDIPIMMKVFMG